MAIIVSDKRPNKIELDLDSSEGNVFMVMGTAAKLARQIGYAPEEIKSLTEKWKSGSYGQILVSIDQLFGDFIDLKMSTRYMGTINDKTFKLYFLKQ